MNYLTTDTDLTAVADAIRAKVGVQGALMYPDDYIDFIGELVKPTGTKSITENGTNIDVAQYSKVDVNVSGGGGISIDDFLNGAEPSGSVYFTTDRNVPKYGISTRRLVTELTIDLTGSASRKLAGSAVINNNALTRLIVISQPTHSTPYATRHGSYAITENSALTQIIFRGSSCAFDTSGMRANSALTIVDIEDMMHPSNVATFPESLFYGCTNLNVLILRQTSDIPTLTSSAISNTKFGSGKAGGTLYVPQSMITTYENASNWSTVLAQSNNSIVKLEGSPYEALDWYKE